MINMWISDVTKKRLERQEELCESSSSEEEDPVRGPMRANVCIMYWLPQ